VRKISPVATTTDLPVTRLCPCVCTVVALFVLDVVVSCCQSMQTRGKVLCLSERLNVQELLYEQLRSHLFVPLFLLLNFNVAVKLLPIRSRNNQHYALICTTPLFYILAPTCFGSSLPSSGSFLDPSELLQIHIEKVVYHITCG
jgi:hypothetical protein